MGLELSEHPILIVDDERPNLELLSRFLRRKYKTIITADDGEQALWILESRGVDLILADQRMPKIDGTELLRQAREIQPTAMRILVTGNQDIETLTAAINAAQVFQVITKPIDFKLLDMIVQRALEAHEAAGREHALFDAFVYAAVNAIEQRDPSTAGHSYRVALMTCGLAMAVDKVGDGPLAPYRFSRDEIEQIRYASLLHDFGKIGVPEAILTKSHKLPPSRYRLFEQRIRHAVDLRSIDDVTAEKVRELLLLLNDPSLPASQHARELRALEETGLAEVEDLRYLRIERGSLSTEERQQIQSHVNGTISFLQQLPWPRRFARVTEIAGAHHEKLNGSGYPAGANNVPIEARMLTVCDIYDALVASDRPYKTAATHERAVEILMEMVTRGELDELILSVFIDKGVYRALKNPVRTAWQFR